MALLVEAARPLPFFGRNCYRVAETTFLWKGLKTLKTLIAPPLASLFPGRDSQESRHPLIASLLLRSLSSLRSVFFLEGLERVTDYAPSVKGVGTTFRVTS